MAYWTTESMVPVWNAWTTAVQRRVSAERAMSARLVTLRQRAEHMAFRFAKDLAVIKKHDLQVADRRARILSLHR